MWRQMPPRIVAVLIIKLAALVGRLCKLPATQVHWIHTSALDSHILSATFNVALLYGGLDDALSGFLFQP